MAKHSKSQIALEYALARSILWSLGALPRRAAIAVGLGIGNLAYHLPGKLRQAGLRNLEIAFPDKSE
jgi:KDO2-lipid IV(A) lauroyltransferase